MSSRTADAIEVKRDRSIYIVNGLTAFLFSCTGPVAIILAVAKSTGLSDAHVASWFFGCFTFTGLCTLYFSWRYRQPIAFAWTIPGTVLLLSALEHLSVPEVVGAYLVTAIFIFIVGITGLAKAMLALMPKPIVMAMVAGVFLDFGLKLVSAFEQEALLASAMVIAFVLFSINARIQRMMPPVMAALLVGLGVVFATDSIGDAGPLTGYFSAPLLFVPEFSLAAMFELVVPLAITVLVVQNGQGFAVLGQAGHKPPVNAMTIACGIGSFVIALVGSVSMCVTGPSNAILSSGGNRHGQYLGALLFGALAVLFGVFSILMTWLAFKLPVAFVAVLGGLAVFRVLQGAFIAAFSGGYTLGALVTLLVTVSDVSLFNIGAPFWGLVFGVIVSRLLEREAN